MASSQQTPQPQSTHDFRLVTTEDDVEALRAIRNECREFMTHDTSLITPEAQAKWWEGRFKRHTLPLLAYENDMPIGYGMITWDFDGIPWLSGGLRAAFRGRGYGRALFTELARIAGYRPVYLDVRLDNAPARQLYGKLGFKQVRRSGELVVMRLD